MQITIVSVGKIKERAVIKGIEDYRKRLSKYCHLTMVEVPDVNAPESLSDKEQELVKDTEGQGILRHLKEGMYVIALDIQGRLLSSTELAHQIDSLKVQGYSQLAFIIGGSLGLSDRVLRRADFRLSFSPMTFPHQLMRLILLEQLHRSLELINGQN